MFSGLNLAFFSLGRLQLEAEAQQGCPKALQILLLRTRSNLLLCTILWGNVSVNVALALLSDSVMTGVVAFMFSTCGITFFGEIMPQAYFSRHALRVGSYLAPVIRFYQVLLWPVAWPCSRLLDRWIGEEGPLFFDEDDFKTMLQRHKTERGTDIGHVEGRGALNFLQLDDLRVSGEGASIVPEAILSIGEMESKDLAERLSLIGHKWAIFTDTDDTPIHALNINQYLRVSLRQDNHVDPIPYCHAPIVVSDPNEKLEGPLTQLVVECDRHDDRVIDSEVILYWSPNSKRIVTGADILGRLLHGIAQRTSDTSEPEKRPNPVPK